MREKADELRHYEKRIRSKADDKSKRQALEEARSKTQTADMQKTSENMDISVSDIEKYENMSPEEAEKFRSHLRKEIKGVLSKANPPGPAHVNHEVPNPVSVLQGFLGLFQKE